MAGLASGNGGSVPSTASPNVTSPGIADPAGPSHADQDGATLDGSPWGPAGRDGADANGAAPDAIAAGAAEITAPTDPTPALEVIPQPRAMPADQPPPRLIPPIVP